MTIAGKIALGKFLWSIRGPFRRLSKRVCKLVRAEQELALRKASIELRVVEMNARRPGMHPAERVIEGTRLSAEIEQLEREEADLKSERASLEASIAELERLAGDRRPRLRVVPKKSNAA